MVILPRVMRYSPVKSTFLIGLLAQIVYPIFVRMEFVQELFNLQFNIFDYDSFYVYFYMKSYCLFIIVKQRRTTAPMYNNLLISWQLQMGPKRRTRQRPHRSKALTANSKPHHIHGVPKKAIIVKYIQNYKNVINPKYLTAF